MRGHDVPSGYVRLELVFEPTQKFFNPKNELLDHLQGALGRSPSPCLGGIEDWSDLWTSRDSDFGSSI